MALKLPLMVANTVGCIAAAACAGQPASRSETVGRTSEIARGADLDADAGATGHLYSSRRQFRRRPVAATPVTADDAYIDAGASSATRLLPNNVDRQRALGDNTAGRPGASGLVLHVLERGPNEAWVVAVRNEGTEPAHFVADTRLLWFEVSVPGAKKTVRCRLPEDLQPKEAEPRLDLELKPGEYVTQAIDPRLYCFASGDQKDLVPGARVIPHLGWPSIPGKATWKAGKKVEVPVPQPPPFVARLTSVDVDAALKARKTALKVANVAKYKKGVSKPPESALGVPLPAGIDKDLVGPELTLQSSYAEWSMKAGAPRAPSDDNPLEMTLVQGSDARTEYNATVQFTLHNRSKRKMLLYFRRELVTFEVVGPNGITLCNPMPDDRSPDRSAFIALTPGAKKTYTSRLAELCPRSTFDMPGLYLVNARYDANESGAEWNLAAYTGSVETETPANVRIRTGELSILQKVALSRPEDAGARIAEPPLGASDAGTR